MGENPVGRWGYYDPLYFIFLFLKKYWKKLYFKGKKLKMKINLANPPGVTRFQGVL